MSQEYEALKWGDIVRIHGVNISKKKKDTKGLIISKGFTDANIYYQIYKEFSDVNFYRESLFQIIPRVNFDMHDQLLDENISEQIKQNLKSRAHGEIQILQTTLADKAGKEIKYGSEVIFRHIQSKSYLMGMMQAANSGQGAFKIEVTESVSSCVIFKLVSPRTFQNQNDKIYYNDALKIYHPFSDSYMNFSQNQEPISLDAQVNEGIVQQIPEDHPAHQFSSKRPSIKRPNDIRTFIINQNKSKCLWKFIQHCSYEEYINKQKIKSHDIVYFEHTKKEEESLVSTTISKPLVSYLKKNENKELSYQCFWELIPKQVNEFGPQDCNVFWARNIVTGQLLSYNQFNVLVQHNGKTDKKGFDNRGLINLVCSENSDPKLTEKLQRKSSINLNEGDSPIQAQYEKKSKKYSFQAVTILPKDIFMIFKVDESALLDAMYVMSAHQPLIQFVNKLAMGLLQLQNEHSEDYPKFFALFQQDELANIVKIEKMLAGKIYGTDYDNIVASGNTPDEKVQRILVQTGIVQILIQIIYHIYEPFKFIEKNNEPSEDRAIRVKMLQIFEYTYKLLEKVAANFENNRIYISRWIDLFLQHSNNVNKSYIQECLVGILHNNPVAIRATINQNKIKNLINNFFKEAEENKQGTLTTKYLRLFSTFIKCEGFVIKDNQNIILNQFIKNPNNQLNIRFRVEYKNEGAVDDQNDPYKIKSKQVQIAFGKDNFMTIKQFFDTHFNKWSYFLAYVNLLADICTDRNNSAIESVSSILSLQAVAIILFDGQIRELNNKIKEENKEASAKNAQKTYSIENIHEPFIRIAHHVYVDNQKFQQIKRIMRISQWHKDAEQNQQITYGFEDINRTKRVFEGEKEEEEQRYLKSILEYIKTYIKQCNQDISNLNMLYTTLSLLKSTVILGLWTSIKSFRELAPQLMLKITKVQNNFFFQSNNSHKSQTVNQMVETNKQKLQMNRPEIALGIKCKIKAIEIFKYMNDLEIDIRLRYIMNFFKGLYECTQNFNLYDQPLSQDVQNDANEQQIDRNQIAKQQYLKMEGKALLGDNVTKMSQDIDILLKQNVWFNKLKELTPFQYARQEDPMKDRYLFQGDSADIQKQNYAEELKQQFSTMVLGLFQLAVYEDYKLLNSSLNMLRIMFEQRKDLLSNFKKILICGKGNLEQVYLTLKFMRQKFNMLANSNIEKYEGDADKSFPYQIKKPYDYLIKDREKRSGIVEDLFFLARTLKDGTSLKNIQSLMSVDEDVFIPEHVYNFINEKQKNNELFQSLNLAEGIYKPLIQYIKIIGNRNHLKDNHRKLLMSIYQYLTLLCFNNLEAKQILMQYIPDILPHLKNKVGAANFLYQVTRNNKLLVSNEEMVTLIIQQSLENCNQLQLGYAFTNAFANMLSMQINNNDFEKSRILFSLRGILLFNDQGHKRNQELLMNKLQDNRYKKLIFQGSIKSKSALNDFDLSPEETYIAYHFELFSVLVESGNMINIGKLQNLHPYQYCLECLQNTNRWQIRRGLRAYINRLYYVNKDKDIFLFEKFISKQFGILNTQLADLVELHKKKLLSEDLKIKNGIRFSYAQSQIFLVIIQCLITLHEIFLKPGFLVILRRELAKDQKHSQGKPLHESFINLFKNLGCLSHIYQGVKIIDPFIQQVKSLIRSELARMPVRYLEKKAEPQEEKIKNQTEEVPTNPGQNQNASMQVEKKTYAYDHSKSFFRNLSSMIKFLRTRENLDKQKQAHLKNKKEVNISDEDLKDKYLDAIFTVPGLKLKKYYTKKKQKKALQYDPHLQTASSRIFKVLAKPQLGENQENIQLNSTLNAVKTMIEDSPTFHKFKDDQFIFFVNKTLSLDEASSQQYKNNWEELNQQPKPVIPVDEVFTKIFKLIMNNPAQIDDQQKIFIIKLIRCYMTEAVEGKQSYKRSVDKWDADYCGDDQLFAKRQTQIELCGGSDFIISIFKQNLTDRVELLNQSLLLGIAYLYGGNHHCQNSILSSLKKDTENIMLTNMKGLIKKIGDFLINVRKIKENQKKRTFAYNIVDTYDYFNSEDKMIAKYFGQSRVDKFQVQIQLDNQMALCRIFRFLQLFCENNNKDMKKFLSLQINEDQSTKPNSINFIEQASILLKKLFKVMNNRLVMIPSNLLAFIGEITQVPILQNQISFIKSTFFEDISYMAAFFDSVENKLQRKFNLIPQNDDDPLHALSQIYEQAVKLALNNFEGNQNIIIKQFLNKCQPKFIWLIIRDQLWALIKKKYSHLKFVTIIEGNDIQSRRKTFENLEQKKTYIQQIIKEEKKQKTFTGPTASILEALIILRKTDDFAAQKTRSALQDKQNPNLEDSADAQKAKDFRLQIIRIAKQQYKTFDFEAVLFFFNQLILQIQINCENGQQQKLQYLYFPNHPVFQYLAASTRDKIMVEVTRDTPRDKLISLLDFRQQVYDQIQWNYDLNFFHFSLNLLSYKFDRQISITSKLCYIVRQASLYCSYIIILLMFRFILAEHELDDGLTTYFTYQNWREKFIIKFFCAIQLLLMLLYTLLWYVLCGELAFKKYLKAQEEEEEKKGPDQQVAIQQQEVLTLENVQEDVNQPKVLVIAKKVLLSIISIMKTIYEGLKKFCQNNFITSKIIQFVSKIYTMFYNVFWLRLVAILNESEFKSILFFLVTAILGNFSGVEWYTIHLFNVFVGIPQLINVFKAIIQNIKLLLILSALAALFVSVFNILSLSTYVPVIYEEELPEESCESIIDCVLVVYTSGAIGDDMESFQFFRFSFDLLYVVFMELLFQNLVGGIMIDAYMGLTSADADREKDKKDSCYICSMSKSNIQKLGQTFKKHTQKHFLWNYLYYIYCLSNKDSTDYTGIEYIIFTKIQEEDVSWFPSLGGEGAQEEVEQKLMNSLSQKLVLLKDNKGKLLNKIHQVFDESAKVVKKRTGMIASQQMQMIQ